MYSRVYVEITNICNMNCSFCHGHSRASRQMTETEYARVLEQLAGKTQYIYHHLMGEPLVHPLLPRFIQMARQAGFRPMITTNGTLLDRFGDALLTQGLHKVNVSLHSFEGFSRTLSAERGGFCTESNPQRNHHLASSVEQRLRRRQKSRNGEIFKRCPSRAVGREYERIPYPGRVVPGVERSLRLAGSKRI